MTRADLLRIVASETDEPLGIVEQIVAATFATIRAALDAGERVDIDNFGRFSVRQYEPRTERLPDRVIEYPAHQQVVFKAEREWRRVVNTGMAAEVAVALSVETGVGNG